MFRIIFILSGCVKSKETDFRMSNSIINNLTFTDQKKNSLLCKMFVKALALRVNDFYVENLHVYACLTCLFFQKLFKHNI